MALAASTTRRPVYRWARVLLGGVVVLSLGWYVWTVVFAGWRPWEGSSPRLRGVDHWAPIPGPVPGDWDGRVAVIKTDGDRLVQIVFWGDACTHVPWRIRGDDASGAIVLEIDPDPRGCRGGDDENAVRRHAAELTLREPIAGRPVEVHCSGSSRCGPMRLRGM
jgi:hypothetical protein